MDLTSLAASIVFKRIIAGMLDYADCDVICPQTDAEMRHRVELLPCPNYKRLPYRIEKKLQDYQGYRISETWWAEYTFIKVKSAVIRGNYDAILSFIYAANFAPLHLGDKISRKTNLPWIVYSVDAIPAPFPWWQESTIMRNKLYRHLNNYIPKATAFFSANPTMLQYEKNIFTQFNGYSGVLLTPCDGDAIQDYVPEHHDHITFLYTGSIYGPRRVDALLAGFEEYQKKNPTARLVFLGKNRASDFVGYETLLDSNIIELHDFTTKVEYYFKHADVLIDLNADAKNDVFLSSKVCNYLSYNKPIIAISQDGSPVRAMMSNIESIIHSHHSVSEISHAMEKATVMVGQPITDREVIRREFMPKEVAKRFCKELEALVGNYK